MGHAEDVGALGQEACPAGLYSPEPRPAPRRTRPANLNRPEQVPWVSTLPGAAGWPLFRPSRHRGAQIALGSRTCQAPMPVPQTLEGGVQRGSPGVRAGLPAPWRCALTSPGAGAPPGKGGQLISGHPAHGPPKAPKPEPVERTAAGAPHSGTSSLECGGIPAKPGNSGVFWGPRRPADPLTQGPKPQAAGVCAYTESSPTTHEPSPILNTVHAPPPAWSAFQMARGLQPHHPWSPLPPPTQNPPRHPESEKSRLPLPHKRQTDCKPRTPGGRGRRTHEWDGVSVPVRIAIYSRSCQNHHRGFTEGCVRGGGGSNTD